jgi:predicted Rossmann fold nucleotide-binding protein DprA/Smf involved in DNA uptake
MPINLKGKKLAVIGSRTFDDKQRLYDILTKNLPNIKLIISGGATGADTLATQWASDYGLPYLVFPALWHDPFTGAFNRGAGFARNRYIIEHCDVVMAFMQRGGSKGTQNSLDIAKELGKPIKLITFDIVKPVEKTSFEL